MNNMSLVKITLGVAFAAITTFIVNASDALPTVENVNNEVATASTSSTQSFSKLLAKFDADNNGVLSESELLASDNESLKMAFKHLDVNNDANISEEEFNAYVGKALN